MVVRKCCGPLPCSLTREPRAMKIISATRVKNKLEWLVKRDNEAVGRIVYAYGKYSFTPKGYKLSNQETYSDLGQCLEALKGNKEI